MNKEKYEELIRRFAQQLHEVGVTPDMQKMISAQCERAPNVVSASSDETTDKFTYRHDGYIIEAERSVKLVVRKCK